MDRGNDSWSPQRQACIGPRQIASKPRLHSCEQSSVNGPHTDTVTEKQLYWAMTEAQTQTSNADPIQDPLRSFDLEMRGLGPSFK